MEGKFGEKVWLVAQKDCHLFSIDRNGYAIVLSCVAKIPNLCHENALRMF
jgi:hypothetical protein